jgi:hypothetical protein
MFYALSVPNSQDGFRFAKAFLEAKGMKLRAQDNDLLFFIVQGRKAFTREEMIADFAAAGLRVASWLPQALTTPYGELNSAWEKT